MPRKNGTASRSGPGGTALQRGTVAQLVRITPEQRRRLRELAAEGYGISGWVGAVIDQQYEEREAARRGT